MSEVTVVPNRKDCELYEALSILKNFGVKQPRNSTYGLARQVLVMINGPYNLQEGNDKLSDFVECPQTTQKMLKNIRDSLSTLLPPMENQHQKVPEINRLKINLNSYITSQKAKIEQLECKLQTTEKKYKTTHLKLLNNVKKLTQQLHEREQQLHLLNQQIMQKDDEIESLSMMNQKKYKKIKSLESDISTLHEHIQQKQQQLDFERKCSTLLETTVNKIVNEPLSIHSDPNQDNHRTTETGTQVEQEQEETINDKISESSAMTESKQNKYLESIERLTAQLSQAYARINHLTSLEQGKKLVVKAKTHSTYFGRAKK